MPSSFTGRWILPIAGPPIEGGSITIDEDRILSVDRRLAPAAVDLGRCAILPALANAHTHLELSHLRGRIPRASCFTDWVRPLLSARATPPPASEVRAAALAAAEEARRAGTGLFGDVSNALQSVDALGDAPAHVFHELIGFNTPDPAGMVATARSRIAGLQEPGSPGRGPRVTLAPHAPYSVSPGLFDAIRADTIAHGGPTTVHLAESTEEVQLLADGSGPWRALLERLGVWTEQWQPPRMSPVAYVHARGFLDASVLAVHCVQCTAEDVALLRGSGATVVSCPRSNAYVGAGSPPLGAWYAAGVPVAFGTDSLASVDDLNLFGELAEARRLAPGVPARALLESATLTGARALGLSGAWGTLEPGKRAPVIAVRVPDGVTDVEEYLVSGIAARDVSWVSARATGPAE